MTYRNVQKVNGRKCVDGRSPSPLAGEGGPARSGGPDGGLRLRKLDAAHPRQVDPITPRAADDPHQDRFAARTAHDRARRVHVDVDPADRIDRAAAGACRLGGGHLHREDLTQETPDRIAVELPFTDAHLNLL